MKINKFDSTEEWMQGRLGKVTGSRLKDLVVKRGASKKAGFYKLISEKIAEDVETDVSPMERGHILEKEAIDEFSGKEGKEVKTDLVIWERDDNPDIAISPDGYIDGEEIIEAVEVKCLASHVHIESYLKKEPPKEYLNQIYQYFIVNDNLETLHFVMYDPRFQKNAPDVVMFVLRIYRDDIKDEIKFHYDYQVNELEEVSQIIQQLTF